MEGKMANTRGGRGSKARGFGGEKHAYGKGRKG